VFAAMDRILDTTTFGKRYLGVPEVAKVVVDSLRDGELKFQRHELHSFVVMPNHVHVVVTPRVPARERLGRLKGFTAREGNRILGMSGRRFWQDESYDHVVREGGFERIREYIEWNPVKAGLVDRPERFR
jgi:REP element-mobilizing transposase RayT